MPGLRHVADRLGEIDPSWIVLAVALELVSCLGFAAAFQHGSAPPVGALTLTGAMIRYGASPATAAAAGLVYHAVLLCGPMLLGTLAFIDLRRSAPPPERRRAPGHGSRSR